MGRGMSAEVRRATRGEALNGWLDERTDHDGCLDLKKKKRTHVEPNVESTRMLVRSLARSFPD